MTGRLDKAAEYELAGLGAAPPVRTGPRPDGASVLSLRPVLSCGQACPD
jgi:hypothetical protein